MNSRRTQEVARRERATVCKKATTRVAADDERLPSTCARLGQCSVLRLKASDHLAAARLFNDDARLDEL